jgi:transposase-like protein
MPKKVPEWLDDDIREFYHTCQGNIRAIQRAITERRGVEPKYMTITDHMKQLGLERPRDKSKKAPRETPMSVDETPVEVLAGQMSIEDADTPAQVHYGAVHEFDRLPDGYAKVIQPMRPYSDAEEWALNESMRLYGFIGAIVCDQFGRVLDGNQRQRIARLRGLSVPHTITHVKDDAHAIEIATAANAVRRHYTQEQRQELAPRLRDQGFSYRAIADALGVGKSTVYRDILGELKIRPEPEDHSADVPNGTPEVVITSEVETNFTPEPITTDAPVPNGTPQHVTSEQPTGETIPEPVKRVKGRDKKSYPGQRPTGAAPRRGQAEETRERMGQRGQPNGSWINVLSQAHRLCSSLKRQSDLNDVLESWGPEGRQKATEYLEPLYDDIKQLLWSLHGIDAKPLETE